MHITIRNQVSNETRIMSNKYSIKTKKLLQFVNRNIWWEIGRQICSSEKAFESSHCAEIYQRTV